MLTVASEPKNAKLTVMLGVNPILSFFVKCRGTQPEPSAPKEETKESVVVKEVKNVAVVETFAQRYARQLA